MKRIVVAAAALAALSSVAFAQSTTVTTTTGAANAQVTIAPDQRTKIKSYITSQNIKPVTVKEKVVIGATLPADVTLTAVPADWGPEMVKYRYIYVDNHVALVDPSSRRVVTVID